MYSNLNSKHLVLDAMGVIYKESEFKKTLSPFIRKNGGSKDAKKVEELYYAACMGELTAEDFWKQVGTDYKLEDEYLSCHSLSDGLIAFLEKALPVFKSISCLSNNVPEWSKKLRDKFQLDRYISRWYISGDLKCRKPSCDIYKKFLQQSGYKSSDIIFVDDRKKNLEPAQKLGFTPILFDSCHATTSETFITISSLNDIFTFLK